MRALVFTRRVVVVKIEPGFSQADDVRLLCKFAYTYIRLVGDAFGIVRMDADDGKDIFMFLGKCDGLLVMNEIAVGTDDDETRYSCVPCPGKHRRRP